MDMTEAQIIEWRELVSERVAGMDWDLVIPDVRPFLERAEDIALLTKENVPKLLKP